MCSTFSRLMIEWLSFSHEYTTTLQHVTCFWMWEKVRRRGGLSLNYSRIIQGRRRGGIVGDGGWTCWGTTTLIPVNPLSRLVPNLLSHSEQQKLGNVK